MITLFDSRPRVKSGRKPFALGLGRTQAGRLPIGPSDADRKWAAYELNKHARDYTVETTAEDRHYDRLAEVSAAVDLAQRGIRAF